MRPLLLASLALLLAGCGAQEREVAAPKPKPSPLRAAEADVRSELQAIAAAVGSGGPRFERVAAIECENATGHTGRVTSGLRATLDVEPGDDPAALVRRAVKHWRARGWSGRRTGLPAAFATRRDGMTLAIKALADGSIELAGGTPCVRA